MNEELKKATEDMEDSVTNRSEQSDTNSKFRRSSFTGMGK